VIASIREFAEYIPLQQEMFDLVVIDEASQVSVAQAFPALLRAKKVIVFGDREQFSNVKALFASNEQNNSHVNNIKDYFRTKISDDAARLQRAARFDVKRSVLDFFELIRNFEVQLRKHFRGYQELISFSSEYFYKGRLQAVKFRGKPLDEVIKFSVLDHDGRQEKYHNANGVEADFIIGQLEKFLEMDEPPTVGVITPFPRAGGAPFQDGARAAERPRLRGSAQAQNHDLRHLPGRGARSDSVQYGRDRRSRRSELGVPG
jgi:superfamily I DNA and/or RNA helicase